MSSGKQALNKTTNVSGIISVPLVWSFTDRLQIGHDNMGAI